LEASSAQQPNDPGILLQLGQAYHDAAAAEQKDAAAKAEKALRRVLELSPTNAVARAYLGSALTLRARDAVFPPTKLSLAREGFREMDAAVRLSPESTQPRLIRGLNSVSVPKLFDRLKFAEEDLGWIHQQPFKEGDYGGRPLRQRVALEYGRVLNRLKNADKARNVWQDGVELDPGSITADLLRAELKTSGKP
jgi:tetratricopeptide (TPR) repeat protein